MSDYICTKKCYRGGKIYAIGEEYIGDVSKPIPKEFVKKGTGLTAPKKGLKEEPDTFFEIQKRKEPKNLTSEQKRARRALGHKSDEVVSTRDAEDPFFDLNDKKEAPISKAK